MDPSVPPETRAEELATRLRALANPANVAGMSRYGINPTGTLGVTMPRLREIARDFRIVRRAHPEHVHEVALALWESGLHEARILAGILDVPTLVTREQAERWVADIDSWDVCDQVTGLFAQTPFARDLAVAWADRRAEFVKRAGFVVMCHLAVHDKGSPDEALIAFLPVIEREAGDERPYVKKGVNWALRQIGKRSPACHAAAVTAAERILDEQADSPSARWVARDALRELRTPAVVARFASEE